MPSFASSLIVGLALTLGASAGAAAANKDTSVREVRTPTYHGVVFGWGWAHADGVNRLDGHPVAGAWTPNATHVAALENGLVAYLRASPNKRAKTLVAKLGTYKRQYFGMSNANKQRFVYATFFCRVPDTWKKRPHSVDDGGDCYFQVAYDVASKTFVFLHINGSA